MSRFCALDGGSFPGSGVRLGDLKVGAAAGIVHNFGGRFAWPRGDGLYFVPTYFGLPGVGFWSQKSATKFRRGPWDLDLEAAPGFEPPSPGQKRDSTGRRRAGWNMAGPNATKTNLARRPKFGSRDDRMKEEKILWAKPTRPP